MIRAIVLAAGKGTRMKSEHPKVLHELCGRPMLWYVLRGLRDAGIDDILVVTNEQLQEHVGAFDVRGVVQEQQLGTGHAVKIALEKLEPRAGGRLVVAYGDMPLIGEGIYRDIVTGLNQDGDGPSVMALLTVKMPLPSSFGRIVRDGSSIARIVEARDANDAELAIDEMNAGVYAFDEAALREAVGHLRDDNAQKEYYLTDTVSHFVDQGRRVKPVLAADHRDALGINDRIDLARSRKEMNARLCEAHMRRGVTIIDPETTYLEPELTIGRDTVVYPNSTIGRLSQIGDGCVIGPNARLSNAVLGRNVTIRESVVVDTTIGNDVLVGPYAHLRAETVLGDDVRIGNFVEIKKSKLSDGVKASHLSYLGDAIIGQDSNIGAGTITCNYDGENKNPTVIGQGVFIGSNSSLVAPISIGDGALTGAGAVVIRDVPPGHRVVGNPARALPIKEPS
jgi:bifunctional UDP-N-acetylglucosamine pyrophosphorylase/glucosamine-1-phosphate N-acetyltransferase